MSTPPGPQPERSSASSPERSSASSIGRARGPASGVLRRLLARPREAARYQVEGEIARGGMGVVKRVWDEDLGRALAMKSALVQPRSAAGSASERDARMLDRFLEEAQITGQLEHPGVVPVHELGVGPDGEVYFTMRLVKGRDLEQVFAAVRQGQEGWTRTRALNVMLRVCETMAFAHEKGVIHRDLKPANVMVGRFGETYVMDWGLARVLDRIGDADAPRADDAPAASAGASLVHTERAAESSHLTLDGDIVGTPCYMPPEQARGRLSEVGRHSDVYSVGAMLYHLLTGRMPYAETGEQPGPSQVLQRLLTGPPQPMRALAAGLPEELVAITEKAMAREPAQRYADMSAMAEDLRAFLEDRVVRAHETGSWAELKKWYRRNRASALLGLAAGLAALGGLGAALWLQGRANERLSEANVAVVAARDRALAGESAATEARRDLETANGALVEARDQADREALAARRSEYAANLAAAGASLRLADAADARRRLDACEAAARGFEWMVLRLATDPSERTLLSGGAVGTTLAIAPDDRTVASLTEAGQLTLVDVLDGRVVYQGQHADLVAKGLRYSPDGRHLAAPTTDKSVALFDVARQQWLPALAAGSATLGDFAFAPAGSGLATAGTDKLVRLWSLPEGRLEREFAGHRSTVTALCFTPDGRTLISGSRDRTVRVWDVATGRQARVLSGFDYPVGFVGVDAFGVRVAAGTVAYEGVSGAALTRGANTVRMWSLDDGELLGVFQGPRGLLTAGGFSPDDRFAYASSDDGALYLWELGSGRDRALLGHGAGIDDARFSSDGRWIASCSSGDGTLRVWAPDLGAGFTLTGHASPVRGATFDAGRGRMLTAGDDGTLRTWDRNSGTLQRIARVQSGIQELQSSNAGRFLAIGCDDGQLRVVDSDSGDEILRWGNPPQRSRFASAVGLAPRAAFSPDASMVLVTAHSGGTRVLELPSGRVLATLGEEVEFAWRARWSPDGTRIAVSSTPSDRQGNRLRVWAWPSQALLLAEEPAQRVSDLAFSPDGATLAVAAGNGVRLLRSDDLSPKTELPGHSDRVTALAYSTDGLRLASAGRDDSIRIWDPENAETLAKLACPAPVTALAFEPQGTALLAALEDRSAVLWDTRPTADRALARAQEEARRAHAQPLLDGLFASLADPAAVVDRLRNDPGLSAEEFRTASVLARLVSTDPRETERECWSSVRSPAASREAVNVALWSARCALKSAPEDERMLRLLGVALYRSGDFPGAVDALERSRAAQRNRDRVEVLAFLAMAYQRVGSPEQASAAYEAVQALMQVPANLVQAENLVLAREAQAVLGRMRTDQTGG